MTNKILLHLPIKTRVIDIVEIVDRLVGPDIEIQIELIYTEYIKSKVLFLYISLTKRD